MNKTSAHLLVVDDDPVTLNLLKEVLLKEGYEVATALGGEEAITQGMDNFFDIIITDVRMMDKNGMEVLRSFKKLVEKEPWHKNQNRQNLLQQLLLHPKNPNWKSSAVDIKNVDAVAKSIAVVKGKAEKTFVVDDKTKITIGKDTLSFAYLKKDMNVSLEYNKVGDKLIAVAIKVAAPKAPPEEAPKK